jgi:hypothetical protein
MSLVALSVDVYCDNTYDKQPYYRLYVDGELLTERAWIWHAYETYIQENMEVDIDSGKHHVQIDNCGSKTIFDLRNLMINGIPFHQVNSPQDLGFSI